MTKSTILLKRKPSNDPGYLAQIRPDEERFLDLHGCDFIVSEENFVL